MLGITIVSFGALVTLISIAFALMSLVDQIRTTNELLKRIAERLERMDAFTRIANGSKPE